MPSSKLGKRIAFTENLKKRQTEWENFFNFFKKFFDKSLSVEKSKEASMLAKRCLKFGCLKKSQKRRLVPKKTQIADHLVFPPPLQVYIKTFQKSLTAHERGDLWALSARWLQKIKITNEGTPFGDIKKFRYAENSSKTTRRMQLVESKGRKTGRKLTRRTEIECKLVE